MILPSLLTERRRSGARKAIRAGLLFIGLAAGGVASGRYHFDYRVVGTRCLPRITYDNGHEIYLWMNRRPGCQPVRASTGTNLSAKPLRVFREAPYWVVGGVAPEVVLTLRKGQIRLRADASGPDARRLQQTVGRRGSGPLRKWRLHPGSLRLQLLHWSLLAGYRLVWKGPVWWVRHEHRGHIGLWHALEALTLRARSRGRILRIRVFGGNRVIAVDPGP